MLKEKLQKDLLEAMKSKDKDTLHSASTLSGSLQSTAHRSQIRAMIFLIITTSTRASAQWMTWTV